MNVTVVALILTLLVVWNIWITKNLKFVSQFAEKVGFALMLVAINAGDETMISVVKDTMGIDVTVLEDRKVEEE